MEYYKHVENSDEINEFHEEVQQNKIVREANQQLNNLLLEYSENRTKELSDSILSILNQKNIYVILTYYDNNDPNDNKSFTPTNSINFRKIKNEDIGVFTDFDIMRNYVSNSTGKYISSDIMLLGDFVDLCIDYGGIETITLNFTLPSRFTFNINADK